MIITPMRNPKQHKIIFWYFFLFTSFVSALFYPIFNSYLDTTVLIYYLSFMSFAVIGAMFFKKMFDGTMDMCLYKGKQGVTLFWSIFTCWMHIITTVLGAYFLWVMFDSMSFAVFHSLMYMGGGFIYLMCLAQMSDINSDLDKKWESGQLPIIVIKKNK
ncbi:hypothetical protein [Cytobacillus sp. NCCP-133]|uniref:hypothetical protein n=1 Tax=Cytobacillus sp. NCCP-133 TaxID=766848 RepID=UPI0022327089|nr:hypothetical protein [Cytobacillus sp. NCCP-133]GLB58661.1 hypothetical protein NCCP133_07940 [Cytobacillus sp. NCCP-133]